MILSGYLKSRIASPSLKNSGFDTTSNNFLFPLELIIFSILSPVDTGAVDLVIMILNFFQRVMELKNVPIQGLKDNIGLNDVEYVAEHTYSTALLYMIFSDLHGFDTEKIIKMALIHDLAESVIGNLTHNQKPKNKKNKLENTTMKQILKKMIFW